MQIRVGGGGGGGVVVLVAVAVAVVVAAAVLLPLSRCSQSDKMVKQAKKEEEAQHIMERGSYSTYVLHIRTRRIIMLLLLFDLKEFLCQRASSKVLRLLWGFLNLAIEPFTISLGTYYIPMRTTGLATPNC